GYHKLVWFRALKVRLGNRSHGAVQKGSKGMSTSFSLRRVLAGLLLICGFFAGGQAWAVTNCKATQGPKSIPLSPWPYSKAFKVRTESPVSFRARVSGKLPSRYW